MAIERIDALGNNKGNYLITCDTPRCGASLDAMNMTFLEAVAHIKQQGWTLTKVFSTWRHDCPGCANSHQKR